MALSILDGNQTAVTLATTVSGGAHYPNHIIASGTVTANVFGKDANSTATPQIPVISYDEGIAGAGSSYVVPVQVTNLGGQISEANPLQISGTITVGNSVTINSLPAGTNRIGVVTIGAGTVTIGAGTAQIGSVTASISGTVPVSISSVTIGNSVTIGSCVTHGVTIANTSVTVNGTFYQATQPVSLTTLPALVAGTAQIGSVTASISNSVVTFYPMQGTSVSNTNFTSLTSSTSLVSAVANREVLTVFNEGAGNLHISPGATCTTVAYQVRLSSGDYWECPQGQLSLAHTAVFATAGTARVTQVS